MGAFPFPSLAPAILDFGALVKAVAIYTGRYKKVLKRHPDPIKLLFRSLAVHDRKEEASSLDTDGGDTEENPGPGFEYYEDDDDEDLSLAALDALDAVEVFGHAERSNINHARIPLENLRNLVAFLLVVAPMGPNQPIAVFADRFATPEALRGLQETAECVVKAFRCRDERGILFKDFKATVRKSMVGIYFRSGTPRNWGLAGRFLTNYAYSHTYSTDLYQFLSTFCSARKSICPRPSSL